MYQNCNTHQQENKNINEKKVKKVEDFLNFNKVSKKKNNQIFLYYVKLRTLPESSCAG